MEQTEAAHSGKLYVGMCLGAIVLAGLLVGRPTLDAGHLGGDDEHLIYNHALVNHPSLTHALKLFKIVHRDLYQPIPLLTFQIEFALHGGDVGALHLSNVLIHTLNGVLVWLLFRRLSRNRFLPLMMSLMFVVHPLAVESFAWLNGRMIMLSTTFSLCSLIVFDWWRRRTAGFSSRGSIYGANALHHESHRGLKPAALGILLIMLVLLFVVLAMMSKVRLGLPFLFLLLPLWQRFKPGKSWWLIWSAILLVTMVFVLLNIYATAQSELFEGGKKYLVGPNLARVILALGWYVGHYVWPAGLAPWYAPPKVISWGDPQVLVAAVIFVVFLVLIFFSLRWSRVGLLGLTWFLATIASTLPIIPARNLMVADRYAYLPIIGLHWVVASAFLYAVGKIGRTGRLYWARVGCWVFVVALLAGWTGVSRSVTNYYHDRLIKVKRMIAQSPDQPTLLSSQGWCYYELGDYARAIEFADKELKRFGDDNMAFCKAMNLRALSQYSLNQNFAGAEHDLLAAIQRDPKFVKSYYRLGLLYSQEEKNDQAVVYLNQAVELEPELNPALKLLGSMYRQAGQLDRAVEMYESALRYSRGYDVEAINALGEIEIQQGRYESAVDRYHQLLAWFKEGIVARINLAIALSALNRDREAIEEFLTVLRYDPASYEAGLNLAMLYQREQREAEAWEQYRALLEWYPQDRRVLVSAADYLRRTGRYAEAADLWKAPMSTEPQAADILAWYSLHQWYVLEMGPARTVAERSLEIEPEQPIAHITLLMTAIKKNQPEIVAELCEHFVKMELSDSPQMYEYAFEALEFCSMVDSDSPWPYYVTTVLLSAQGRHEVAQKTQQAFEQTCKEEAWRTRLQAIVERAHRSDHAEAADLPSSNSENE